MNVSLLSRDVYQSRVRQLTPYVLCKYASLGVRRRLAAFMQYTKQTQSESGSLHTFDVRGSLKSVDF